MRHATLVLLAALAAVNIAGCDSSSDDEGASPPGINPPTSDILFGARVDALDDVTVDVLAILYSTYGPRGLLGDHPRFAEGNVLTACVGTACTPLTWNFFEGGYVGILPYVAATPYTISLSRQIDVSALNNSVTLPVPFTILAPAAGSQFTEGQTITLQWSPAEINPTRSYISGRAECEHPSAERTSRGIDLWPFAQFDLGTASNVVRCDVKLTVRMETDGCRGQCFPTGSHFNSLVERSVMIKYTPLAARSPPMTPPALS